MESTVTNIENIECGKIFLSLENFAGKGKIMVNCFCEGNFDGFQDYTNHLLIEHYPQIQLQDRNYQNVKVEKNLESKVVNTKDNTNEMMKILQTDHIKCDDDILFDAHKFMDTFDDSSEDSVSEIGNTLSEVPNESLISVEKSNFKFNKNKKCPHCDRKFFLASSLKHHISRCSNENGSYKCNSCKSRFHLKFSLKMHIKDCHKKSNSDDENRMAPKVSRRQLNFCQNIAFKKNLNIDSKNKVSDFSEIETTNNDITTGTLNVSEPGQRLIYQVSKDPALEFEEFHCEICNKTYSGQTRFNSHMNRHKPCEFKCTTCLKAFKTAGELQTHTRFHTGERPYLCSSCGETFATVSKLINHTRRHHTFERTKVCEICNKKFFGSGELKVHLQATHSNARPFACKLCPSAFNRQFSLRTHMKSHENKREYKCNLCSASFNQKCNLTAHKKKTHYLLTDDDNNRT